MNQSPLPDEVREFKQFVESRHGIIDDVRRGRYSWQELFDKWHTSGEQDPIWDQYEINEKQSASHNDYMNKFSSLFDMLSKVDIDQLEKQVNNLSKTIDQVQGFLKKSNHSNPYHQYNQRKRFF
ncbi:hypothetical protein E3U55_05765 [Filobacillus milosensis]|uniref:Cytosolic protein n=1 Tax=Filobacillus milosensis TaxID=94137 RepID=A0A4Y8IRB1_9BACI|nr:spore coat protein YlbD [Filobacillus milosensis]TFB23324.1 hypothetical protein E3U55_05765 [Filobacillus milosensis]